MTYVPFTDERTTEEQAEADAADLQWMHDHDTSWVQDPAELSAPYGAPVALPGSAH